MSSRPADSNTVTLGPNDRLIGQLYIDGDLRVSGTVEGELEVSGNVEVGEGANVKASISGRGVNISGRVDGKVSASDKLVVGRSGSLTGDIRVARLVIQDGAKFSGNVSMGKPAETPHVAELPAAAEPVAVVDGAEPAEAASEAQQEKPKARKR